MANKRGPLEPFNLCVKQYSYSNPSYQPSSHPPIPFGPGAGLPNRIVNVNDAGVNKSSLTIAPGNTPPPSERNYATPFPQPFTAIGILDQPFVAIQRSDSLGMPPPPSPSNFFAPTTYKRRRTSPLPSPNSSAATTYKRRRTSPPPAPNCSAATTYKCLTYTNRGAYVPRPRATPVDPGIPALSRSVSRTSSYTAANLVEMTKKVTLPQNNPTTTMLSYDKDGSCMGDCSSQSCDGGCSIGHCTSVCIPACDLPSCDMPSCEGSRDCDALDICSSYNCTDSPVCVDNSCPWTSFGHDPAFGNDFSNQSIDTGENDPMHCLWVMPGQQCDVSVPTMESLGQHVLHEHIEPQGFFTCPIGQCAEKLDAQRAPSHLKHEHNPDSYVCLWQNCGQTFPDAQELDSHMKISHANLDCHWAGCEVSTKELSQLKNHVDIDHLQFPGVFESAVPPFTFQTSIYPGHQPLRITTQSPFTSSHTSPVNLDQKPFLHSAMVPLYQNALPSPISSEQRAFQNDVIPPNPVHFKHPVGIGEEGCRCMWITDKSIGQVCGMAFKDGNELQLHVDQDHVWTSDGNSTGIVLHCHWLPCKRNGKPLQNKEKLRRHLFTHTGYWIACCSFCGKQFNNTVALENHERVHTGEKPFACKDCEQCFATEAALTIHKRHHTGEKPLTCPVCGYASADSSNMAKHKKTHEPHEHFCQICHKGFSRSGTLERHKKVHDPNRPLRRKRAPSQISS